ncbi:MAG: outer membrane protein assembly factor BamD [Methylococcales bacterium]
MLHAIPLFFRAFLWLLQASVTVLALSACSSLTEQKDEKADWTAEQFYTEAKQALRDERFKKAIELYETLETRFPFGIYATQGQLEIGYAYYKSDEPDSAVGAADRFIKLHPRHPNVDYAHYLKGLVNYNRSIGFLERFIPTDSSQRDPGSARDAFNDFQILVDKFPKSRYAADSRQRMIALRNNLAIHEIHVGRYYMKKQAYVAAIKRMIYVIENYQRTPAIPIALKIMEAAYKELAMNDLAADAARVYAMNYPNGIPNSEYTDLSQSLAEDIWSFIGLDED